MVRSQENTPMRNPKYRTHIRIASSVNVALGALLIASPWLLAFAAQEPDLTRNSVVIGALIAIFAALRVLWPGTKAAWSGANIALGFWTLISSVTFGRITDETYVWLSVAAGLAVIVFGSWSGNTTLLAERELHDAGA